MAPWFRSDTWRRRCRWWCRGSRHPFLDDDAHRIAVLVLVFVEEHHGSAFAFHRQPFGFQIGDDARQHRVIQAFAHHVVFGQRDVQAVIGQLILRHGDVDQLAPHFQAVLIAALQLHDVSARALGELGIFVVMLLGFAVELFQIGQAHVAGVFILHFSVGNQHAELVPQSPTWLARITLWPRNSWVRAAASPMMVERRWPTCISFATFGAE